VGRLTAEDIQQLILERGVRCVVDASHPFAEEASKNAMAGAQGAGVTYIRYERESLDAPGSEKLIIVEDYVQAAELAADKRGVIMLT
ncbi:cobalt-precorrin-6A reductase, partial [Mesorhizobium sp. M00.F.Ca.ET.186.01.1.1]